MASQVYELLVRQVLTIHLPILNMNMMALGIGNINYRISATLLTEEIAV